MVNIPQKIYEIQKEYQTHAQAFIGGEIDFNDFKHKASPYGVYAQKESNTFMIRPRIFSGIVSIDQLKFISDISKRFCNGLIHLTTRQDIQFHKLSIEDTIEVFKELDKFDLINHGAGGNSIRNITCSPLSGVDRSEIFDVTEYAEVSTEFVLDLDNTTKLPRKFKIAFSNSLKDTAYAKFSDLGFLAKVKDGKKGFAVYAAGGLGSLSDVSMLLNEFIFDFEILAYIDAMKKLFEDHGDRTNRAKARVRHIKQRLGKDEFKKLFYTYYETGVARSFTAQDYVEEFNCEIENTFDDNRVTNEHGKDLFSIYVHPECGDLKASGLDAIIEKIESLDYDVDIRLTSTQGMYLRSVHIDDVNDFLRIINSFTQTSNLSKSVVCTGSKNCKIGLQDSQGLLKSLLKLVDLEFQNDIPKLFISGCHNSCGWHHVGLLGFSGTFVKEGDIRNNAYKLHIGGSVEDTGKLGEVLATIKEENIHKVLNDFGNEYKKSKYTDYEYFILNNKELLSNIINRLK